MRREGYVRGQQAEVLRVGCKSARKWSSPRFVPSACWWMPKAVAKRCRKSSRWSGPGVHSTPSRNCAGRIAGASASGWSAWRIASTGSSRTRRGRPLRLAGTPRPRGRRYPRVLRIPALTSARDEGRFVVRQADCWRDSPALGPGGDHTSCAQSNNPHVTRRRPELPERRWAAKTPTPTSWGSRGRGFKSRRPDTVVAGQSRDHERVITAYLSLVARWLLGRAVSCRHPAARHCRRLSRVPVRDANVQRVAHNQGSF